MEQQEYKYVFADIKFGKLSSGTAPYFVIDDLNKIEDDLFEERSFYLEIVLKNRLKRYIADHFRYNDKKEEYIEIVETVERPILINRKVWGGNVIYLLEAAKMADEALTKTIIRFAKEKIIIKQTTASVGFPKSAVATREGVVKLDKGSNEDSFYHYAIDFIRKEFTLIQRVNLETYLLMVFGKDYLYPDIALAENI